MIVEPTVGELLTKANNRYELVIATARRARQIAKENEEQDKKSFEESPVTLAAEEIAKGKVTIEGIERKEENEEINEEVIKEEIEKGE